MSEISENLQLPYIMPSQAQKHVTHNEAIRALDALIQLSVLDRDRTIPPAHPSAGDRHIVAAGASHDWEGQTGHVAAFQDGAWMFYRPMEGWLAWVEAEAKLLIRRSSIWEELQIAGGTGGDENNGGSGDGASGTISGPIIQTQNSSGLAYRNDPTALTENGGYDWRLYYGAYGFANGPAGDQTYQNDVWAQGINMGAIGTRADLTRQYAAWHMESKFYTNAAQAMPWTENFLHVVDIHGGVRRPIAWVGTHDGTYGNIALAASLLNLNGNLAEPKISYDFAGNQCSVYDGLSTTYLTNNVPPHRQRNAANVSTIALPYIDEGDCMVITRPMVTAQVAGSKNSNGPGFRSRGNIGTAATFSAPNAIAATMVLEVAQTQSVGSATIPVTGNGTVNVTLMAGAISEADIGRAFTGTNVPANARIVDMISPTSFASSQIIPANVTGIILSARTKRSAEWSVDANGGVQVDFTTNLMLRDKGSSHAINLHCYNGKMGFGPGATYPVGAHAFDAPLRLKTYTRATLPPASGAGAGAMIYVSDASGGPVLACSDGTAWKVASQLGAAVS